MGFIGGVRMEVRYALEGNPPTFIRLGNSADLGLGGVRIEVRYGLEGNPPTFSRLGNSADFGGDIVCCNSLKGNISCEYQHYRVNV